MKSISFIHCADIHLGHLQFNEPQRLLDFAGAFRRVADYALDNRVDFVLLSGDFFHKRAINAFTLEQAIQLLSPLKEAGIPVAAIEGNHDKAFYQDRNSWLSFLSNRGYIHLLGPRFAEGRLVMAPWEEETASGSWLDLPGVRIYGVGYLGVTTAGRLEEVVRFIEDEEQENKERYTVLMLHAAVNRLLGQDLGGIGKTALEPFRGKIDYLALGHIHSRYELDGWIYNPGALECVHLDEYNPAAEKGFYHVTIGEKGRQVRYVPSDSRPVGFYTISLTGSGRPEEAAERVLAALRENSPPAGTLARVRLTGQTPFSPLNIDVAQIVYRVKEEFSCLYAEVLNLVNLPENAVMPEEGYPVNRAGIERLVYGRLLSREGFASPGQLEEAIEIVRKTKELALAGDEEELVRLFRQYGEKLLAEEDPALQETAAGQENLPGRAGEGINGQTGVSA